MIVLYLIRLPKSTNTHLRLIHFYIFTYIWKYISYGGMSTALVIANFIFYSFLSLQSLTHMSANTMMPQHPQYGRHGNEWHYARNMPYPWLRCDCYNEWVKTYSSGTSYRARELRKRWDTELLGVVEVYQVEEVEEEVNCEYGAAKLRKRWKPWIRKNP